MDLASFITSLPGWVLLLVILFISILATEGGIAFAQNRIKKGISDPEAPISSVVGAMLALLAFVLGFTFSITSSRLSDRSALLMQQANAISTSYLRAGFIPEKQKLQTRQLLREYIDLLLTPSSPDEIKKSIIRIEEINLMIWQQTTLLAQEDIDSELRSLYISSINNLIEIYRERKTVALVYRIRSVIWFSLILLFILSMFSLGYQVGTYKKRIFLGMLLIATAFAMIIVMIADMDSATRLGRFRISQQPLIEVQEMMQKNIP